MTYMINTNFYAISQINSIKLMFEQFYLDLLPKGVGQERDRVLC